MTDPRRGRVQRLFEAALDKEPAERPDFLAEAYAKEPFLREELESLLSAHAEASGRHATHATEDELLTRVRSGDDVDGRSVSAERGHFIGPYRIQREIGRGGMGVVYEATQQEPRRSVAVKVIRGDSYLDEEHVRLFQREGQALARLKHPGIAGIYEAGRTEDGHHFFAMELVAGENLSTYLSKRPADAPWKQELRSRLELFIKVCEAVNYAHQKGVIHRDLKPSNILVSTDDDSGSTNALPTIKILDFGLARVTDPEVDDVTSVTAVGAVRGTLPYMSPEQARGNPADIDLRSDVYSLGVLLYEMLTGARPYQVGSAAPLEAIRVICEQGPMKPSAAAAKAFDADIETIVLKALEKDPPDRYQSALALGDDIERYLADRPILAHPPSAMYQLRKMVSRHRVGFGFAATLFLLVVGFGVVATIQSAQIARERDRAERRRNQAEDLIGFMLGDLRTKLEPVGQLEILDDVGEQALEYFAAVSPDMLSDEELFGQSQAMRQIGAVRIVQGRYSSAIEVLEEALAMGTRLVERNPDNTEWKNGLRQIHNTLGEAYFYEGNVVSALSHHRRQLAISEELAADEPQNPDWQLGLIESLSGIGYLMSARGDKQGAVEEYLEAVELGRALVRRDPSNLEWQSYLAYSHLMVGTALKSLGPLKESAEHYQASLEILQVLNEKEPNHADWRYQSSLAHYYLGALMEMMGHLDEALAHFRSEMKIERELAEHDPENPSWQRDEAIGNILLGGILAEQGEWDRAEAHYQDAVEMLERRVRESPTDGGLRVDLANAHRHQGRLRLELGERDEARRLARTALELLELTDAGTTVDVRRKQTRTESLILLGLIQSQEGESQEAHASWIDALKVIESMDGFSDDLSLLSMWVRVLLHLDRVKDAEPAIEKLTSLGFQHPRFLQICRSKGALP